MWCGNFCEKHPDTAREIDRIISFLDVKPEFSDMSADAIRPLIREKDEEVRDKAISHIEKTLNRRTPQGGKYNKPPTKRDVVAVIDKILDLYLQCWTQQAIAEEIGESQKTVSNVLDGFSKNGKPAEITKDFKPQLYNIWNFAKITNETQHHEEMAQVLSESMKEDVRKEIIEQEPVVCECTPKEGVRQPIENAPIGNFSECSIRPLIKEKDTEIRQEAIRQCGKIIKDKERRKGKV